MIEIEKNVESLPGQIVARLCDIQQDFNDYHMMKLIEQCRFPDNPSIIPNTRFLTRHETKSPFTCKILQKSIILCTLETHDGNFLITSSADDCFIRIFFAHNFEYNRSILKKNIENKTLLLTNDDEILYVWCKTAPANAEFCLIEAFSFKFSTPLFQFCSNKISPIKKFREVTNGHEWRTIWMIDEEKWYQINGLDGIIEKQVFIGPDIPKRNDKVAIDTYKDNLIISTINGTSIVSMDMNGRYVQKTFQYSVEGVRMLVLPNGTLVMSMTQVLPFKSRTPQNRHYSRYYILMCNPITLDVIEKLNVSSPLRLIRSSIDSKVITGYSGTKIFVFDISKKKVLHCLKHSNHMISVSQITDDMIIGANIDYKIYIWNLESREKSMQAVDLFDDYFNINSLFITNEFDTKSPLVLIFNLFKQINEKLFSVFTVYNLKEKKTVKECKIKNLDLIPKYLFRNALLLGFDYHNNRFLFIDLNNFEIFHKIDSIDEYVVKQISNDTFILHEFEKNENKIYLVKISVTDKNNIIKTRLFEWIRVKWSTVNYKNFIYNQNDTIKVFDFEMSESVSIERFIDFKNDDVIKAYSSNNGLYLCLQIDNKKESYCLLFAYRINDKKVIYIRTLEYNCIKDVMMIENYLMIKVLEKDTMTRFVIDLKNENKPIKTFFKYNTLEYFNSYIYSDPSIYANSKYIWLTKLQSARVRVNLAKSFSNLTVYDKETFTEISYIDTDFQLYASNFRVINNGNSVLMRQEKLNEFVIMNLQSNKIRSNIEFQDNKIENEELEWTIDGV